MVSRFRHRAMGHIHWIEKVASLAERKAFNAEQIRAFVLFCFHREEYTLHPMYALRMSVVLVR